MAISLDLIAAYRRAIYRIHSPSEAVDLQVDQYSPALERLLMQHVVREWAIISAVNPASRLLGEVENAAAHARLKAVLTGKYAFFPAVNLDPAEKWPPEEALFILSIPPVEAFALAAGFGQNAFVVGNDAVPRLICCNECEQ